MSSNNIPIFGQVLELNLACSSAHVPVADIPRRVVKYWLIIHISKKHSQWIQEYQPQICTSWFIPSWLIINLQFLVFFSTIFRHTHYSPIPIKVESDLSRPRHRWIVSYYIYFYVFFYDKILIYHKINTILTMCVVSSPPFCWFDHTLCWLPSYFCVWSYHSCRLSPPIFAGEIPACPCPCPGRSSSTSRCTEQVLATAAKWSERLGERLGWRNWGLDQEKMV